MDPVFIKSAKNGRFYKYEYTNKTKNIHPCSRHRLDLSQLFLNFGSRAKCSWNDIRINQKLIPTPGSTNQDLPSISGRCRTRSNTATARKSFTGELEFSDIISDFYLAWFASWVICIKIHGCFVICILSNLHQHSWVICTNYDWFPCSETSSRKTYCWTWRESLRLRTLGGPSMHQVPGSKYLVFAMNFLYTLFISMLTPTLQACHYVRYLGLPSPRDDWGKHSRRQGLV